MTQEDIIRMAREACDQAPREDWNSTAWVFGDETLERFAALVAAAERSACAKVCEDIPLPKDSKALTHGPTIERCAAAIRARGKQ
jgi:hypothetical protein